MTQGETPTSPILEAHNVRKTFRRETGEIVTALDNVSLDVRQGELPPISLGWAS